jgi:opacity protein-like surface antigen
MRFTTTSLALSLLAAIVAAPAGVCAGETPQQAPTTVQPSQVDVPEQVRRPYRGLFGAPADPTSKQSLVLNGTVFGAYDDDVFAADSNPNELLGAGRNRGGWYSGLVAGLGYRRPGERLSFGMTGDVGANRYANRKGTVPTYRAGGNVSLNLTGSTTLSADANLVYAPEYRLGLFISPSTPTGSLDPFSSVVPDYDLFRLSAYRTTVAAGLSQVVGRRSTLDGWYSMSNVQYVGNPADYRSQAGGGRFSHRLTQGLALRLGYSYSLARYDATQTVRPQRVHNIDAGVDYSRALSISRRTKFSFSTGSAVLGADNGLAGEKVAYRYRFIGNANLAQELGRTWKASLAYRRGIDFREGFYDAFLTDGVSAGFGGFFTRRLRFSSSADSSFGTVGFGSSNKFRAYSATAGLEAALTRNLAVYGRYVYYSYNFDAQVVTDPRLARTLERQGVRIGLAATIPVIR